ncbi:hypothetical protein [Niallia taxi]
MSKEECKFNIFESLSKRAGADIDKIIFKKDKGELNKLNRT